MTVETNYCDISADLVDDLERRLSKAEFYLTGAQNAQDVPREGLQTKPPVYVRLQAIEEGIEKLTAQSRVMKELLRLCELHMSEQFAKAHPRRQNQWRALRHTQCNADSRYERRAKRILPHRAIRHC